MLAEFKSDQLFVEKTKLVNKSPTNYLQQVISKTTKENNSFKF